MFKGGAAQMALSDENTTLNFVLSKNIKHKLQVLADADNKKKIGAFVAQKLQEVVEEFEKQILETFGANEFLQTYRLIFGNEHPPLIPYNVEEEYDEEEARRLLIQSLNGIPRSMGRTPGKQPDPNEFRVDLDELLAQADKNNKEPSE
jgi:hypothetical protein